MPAVEARMTHVLVMFVHFFLFISAAWKLKLETWNTGRQERQAAHHTNCFLFIIGIWDTHNPHPHMIHTRRKVESETLKYIYIYVCISACAGATFYLIACNLWPWSSFNASTICDIRRVVVRKKCFYINSLLPLHQPYLVTWVNCDTSYVTSCDIRLFHDYEFSPTF